MPFIDVFYIELLMKHINNENLQAIVPIFDNKIQPLFAFYGQSSLPTIETALKNEQFAVYEVLKKMNTRFVEISNSHYNKTSFF
jgi:molybdopterin-guanine dinucleotide biosynthesis protein A